MTEQVRGYEQDESGRCLAHGRTEFCTDCEHDLRVLMGLEGPRCLLHNRADCEQCAGMVKRDNARLPSADQLDLNAIECIEAAYKQLEEALGWLRSDHSPIGSDLRPGQVARRKRLREAIGAGMAALQDVGSRDDD